MHDFGGHTDGVALPQVYPKFHLRLLSNVDFPVFNGLPKLHGLVPPLKLPTSPLLQRPGVIKDMPT